MIKLTLSASLAKMLPTTMRTGTSARVCLDLDVDSWEAIVAHVGAEFGGLASHVFDDTGRLRSGLLVAVNDDVVMGTKAIPEVRNGDEVYLFTQIAGG